MQQGALEKFLDPRLKFPQKNLQQIARMTQAAAACIHSEESRRSNMDEIFAILRGTEPRSTFRKKSISRSNSCMIECYPQLQRTKSEMKSHLALAMLGVPDFEDDDFYCR